MNGPHDLGGRMGFGPVIPEPNEPVFHAAWERRVLALVLAMGATRLWNIDISRHARESLAWPRYLSASYYEIWLEGLNKLMTARGLLDGPPQTLPKLLADNVAPVLARGGPCNRPCEREARFKPGDPVRVLNLQPTGHTRLPGYLRHATGVISAHHGAHVYPDSNAHGRGEDPQHLYTVRFAASEVFGRETSDELHADLFEPYLDAR